MGVNGCAILESSEKQNAKSYVKLAESKQCAKRNPRDVESI